MTQISLYEYSLRSDASVVAKQEVRELSSWQQGMIFMIIGLLVSGLGFLTLMAHKYTVIRGQPLPLFSVKLTWAAYGGMALVAGLSAAYNQYVLHYKKQPLIGWESQYNMPLSEPEYPVRDAYSSGDFITV